MDRRESLKSILLGSIAGGLVITSCEPNMAIDDLAISEKAAHYFGRTPEEKEELAKLYAETFFSKHHMETLAVLCALILPANDTYGSATDAGVPDFIEFMSKDIPEMQTPLRGGLMWLDHTCNTNFGTEFKLTIPEQQKQVLDAIAYPDVEIPNNEQVLEVQFFSLMRNLTLTGYFTSKMGIEDLGYKGNTPNIWDGVPEEVLNQHGVNYDEEWLEKCIDQSTRAEIAKWDNQGNLIT